MSIESKTTEDLTEQLIKQFKSKLNQTMPALPKSFLGVLARTIAAVYVLLYRYIGFGMEQLFVKTASANQTIINNRLIVPLYEWGELVGIGTPEEATRPEYEVEITVVNQGGNLLAGSELLSATKGVTYVTIETIALDAATKNVLIQATASQDGGDGSGSIGNLKPDDTLSFINPLPAVSRETKVLSSLRNKPGADAEDLTEYRQRIIDRFRKRPQGGALTDYRQWALTVPNIAHAYPSRKNPVANSQTIELRVEAVKDGKPVEPTDAEIKAVEKAVEFDEQGYANRRPLGAKIEVVKVGRTTFVTTINGIPAADKPRILATLTEGVEQYFQSRDFFIEGLDFPPKTNVIDKNVLSGLISSICVANDTNFTDYTVSLNGEAVPLPIDVIFPDRALTTVVLS